MTAAIVHLPAENADRVQADPARGDSVYNEFYAKGGWKYSLWKEYWWHRRNIVRRFGLRSGMRILEVACGNGFHTNLLRRMGFNATGVDRSPAGIADALGITAARLAATAVASAAAAQRERRPDRAPAARDRGWSTGDIDTGTSWDPVGTTHGGREAI